jgi:HNH endonuclease
VLSKFTRTRLVRVNGKRRRAHRVVMEKVLGRALLGTEHVHHINHDPLDNRPENLEVMQSADHVRLHSLEKQKYPDTKVCVSCGTGFQVNPRKRKRNKTCSQKCASKLRAQGRRAQVAATFIEACMT